MTMLHFGSVPDRSNRFSICLNAHPERGNSCSTGFASVCRIDRNVEWPLEDSKPRSLAELIVAVMRNR
jgi:hypothetical protein